MLLKLNIITVWVFEFDYRVWLEDREEKHIYGSDHSSIKNDTLP
jgi:hypothetical protein